MSEIWKDIPGWEGCYQASSMGFIRSVDRQVHAGRGRMRISSGRVLSPAYNKISGYPYVMLQAGDRKLSSSVHGLVALTFLGARPDGLEVRHLDGNPRNAAAANLAYGLHAENMADCLTHGTRAFGDKLPHAVSPDKAAYIRRRLARGDISQRTLAKEIGINRATIMKIAKGLHWSTRKGV